MAPNTIPWGINNSVYEFQEVGLFADELREVRRKKTDGPLPTKVKRSTGGRTQQIRVRLSPTFPKILAMGEKKTDGDRGKGPFTADTKVSTALGPL